MAGTRGGGGASSRSGTSLSSSRSPGKRSQLADERVGHVGGQLVVVELLLLRLARAPACAADSELRVGHEGKRRRGCWRWGRSTASRWEEREQSEAKGGCARTRAELCDGQPMEMGDEAALELCVIDGLGEAAVCSGRLRRDRRRTCGDECWECWWNIWRKRCEAGGMGNPGESYFLYCLGWLGVNRAESDRGAQCGRVRFICGLARKSRQTNQGASEDGMTRDGEKGSQ